MNELLVLLMTEMTFEFVNQSNTDFIADSFKCH